MSNVTDKSVRLNISLSESCYSAIRENKGRACLFNGYTDFAIQALRYFIIKFYNKTSNYLEESKRGTKDPKKIYEKTLKKTNGMATQLYERYSETYPGSLTEQINIRINPLFYKRVEDLTLFTGYDVPTTCRIAIMDYNYFFGTQVTEIESTIYSYQKIYDEAHGQPFADAYKQNYLDLWDETGN